MTQPPSPFESPQAPLDSTTRPGRDRSQVDYMAAYKSFFAQEQWVMSLVFLGLVNIIPILGPIASQGYSLGEVVRQHLRGEDGAGPFTFDKFGDYLGRGVWMFVAGLLASIPVIGVSLVAMIPMIFAGALGEAFAVIAGLLFFVLILGAVAIATILMLPFMLRIALVQGLNDAFSLDFVKDFSSKMWVETLLVMLFLMVTGLVLVLLGMLLCGVGLYPAIGLVAYATLHLMMQLYEVYLSRGGQALEINPVFNEA